MLFAKRPAEVETYNDLNSGLVNLFRVLRDKEQFPEFQRLCELTPYSREEFYDCRDKWESEADPVIQAWRFFVVARMSFGGQFGSSFGTVIATSRRGMAVQCSMWLSAIEGLPEVHARLMMVQVENADFRVILDRYDTPDTLFYCDPPYVPDTRKAKKYDHEMTEADHIDLVDLLLNIKGKCVLSGYPSPVYDRLTEAGWIRKEFNTACHAAGKTRNSNLQGAGSVMKHQPRTEVVWIKPISQEYGLFA